MILILSVANDLHATQVATQLRARGAKVVLFNPARFPAEAEIALSFTLAGECRQVLRVDGDEIDLQAVRAIWYRRPEKPIAPEAVRDRTARTFVEQECNMFVQDLWSSLDCAWLPSAPHTVRHAEQKASQLKVAGELGFELPPTLITNSPDELLAFYREHNGRVISKQASKAFFHTVGQTLIRYTELVTTRDIAHAGSVAHCPMIFQAYVPKRVELRVTVVGREVFAAEIHSQTTNHTRHDWRRYDHGQTPHLPHELPAALEARCVALVEKLGLRYGAIDLVLTPDGRYVFLEINPNGQYLWIEHEAGLPISDAICELCWRKRPSIHRARLTSSRLWERRHEPRAAIRDRRCARLSTDHQPRVGAACRRAAPPAHGAGAPSADRHGAGVGGGVVRRRPALRRAVASERRSDALDQPQSRRRAALAAARRASLERRGSGADQRPDLEDAGRGGVPRFSR